MVWKRSHAVHRPQKSAEARAIERMNDIDDPSKWITVVEEGEEVDEVDLNRWLKNRGYQD